MRALWSGSLSFGLINIPIRLYSAAEERGLSFDMLDKATHEPIAYMRVINGTTKEVKWENIVKGYKYRGGNYVVLEDEDFKRARPQKTQSIEIVSFSDEAEIDPMYYEKPYYLEPEPKSGKAYALLREALEKTGKVAVASFVLREREHSAVIKPEGEILVLIQLRYDEEIRSYEGLKLPERQSFKAGELATAVSLVEHLSAPFDATQFRDTYTEDLMQMIEAKAKGRKPKLELLPASQPTEDKDDLLAMLRESLKAGARNASSRVSPSAGKARTARSHAKPTSAAQAKAPAKRSGAKAAAGARSRARG